MNLKTCINQGGNEHWTSNYISTQNLKTFILILYLKNFSYFYKNLFVREISLGRVVIFSPKIVINLPYKGPMTNYPVKENHISSADPLVQIDRQTSYYFIIRISIFIYVLVSLHKMFSQWNKIVCINSRISILKQKKTYLTRVQYLL